jgi:hypothetical protein
MSNDNDERRRDGRFADAQRAVTGWLLNRFHLRRQTDSRARRRVILLINVVFAAFAFSKTGWGSSGTEGASFLNIPVGARPAALGSGYTALATDAYAPTWNPAGLGFIDTNELAGQHLSYLESIHYEYLSFVHPLARRPFAREGDRSTAGIGGSIQYLGSGDIPGTNMDGQSIGDFSSYYAAYSVAYGQSLSEKLSLGLTGKWINAKISDVSANAFAFDFGALYRATHRLHLASTLTNVGTRMKFLSQKDSLPMSWHVAAAYLLHPQILVTTEAEYRKNGMPVWHMGTEWRPIEAVAIRAGYRTDTTKELSPLAGFTTGIGLKLKGQEFSYAWLPYGDLGNTQYFSAVLRFGGPADKKRNLIQYKPAQPELAEVEDVTEERVTGRMIARPVETKAEAPQPVEAAKPGPKKPAKTPKAAKSKKKSVPSQQVLQDLLDSPQKRSLAKDLRSLQ